LVQKSGFGKYLFYDWRYDSNENQKPDFVLNDKKYQNSKILVTGDNFGCGSSREHAVWALQDYGFSVIIAPSFADIFYSNCFKNGILPIKLDEKTVDKLKIESSEIEVDLENQFLRTISEKIPFEIDPYKKKILLEGLDDIALTLKYENEIMKFEKDSMIPSVL
jgi:3-isopropylmalate/(R)-2-methylmalate dehydratase small subunit